MSAMTYSSLVAQITSYLNRSDASTLAQIPNFISQCEQRIAREYKGLGVVKYVTSNFVTDVCVYQKPARWRRTLSMSYGMGDNFATRVQIYPRVYDFLTLYWPNRGDSSITAPPKFYADYQWEAIIIAPTPALAYPYEWSYLELPAPLSDQNNTNWLTNYAPDAILYGSLLEALPFLKNDDRVQLWQAFYDRALQSLNTQDELRQTDRTEDRGAD